MRLSTFLSIAGLLALVFGVAFLLGPGYTLAQYGVAPDPAIVLMSQFFGVALLQLGLVLFLVRRVEDRLAQRAVLLGGVVGSFVGLLIALSGQLSHLVNALGWSTVAIYLLLLLGYGYFLLASGRTGAV